MSDKKTLLAQEQKKLDAAKAEFELTQRILLALPEQVEPETFHTSGYCAEATLLIHGEAKIPELLQLLPPLDCTYVLNGSFTLKPTSYLRADDRGHQEWAYPVSVTYANGRQPSARWWSTIADTTVQVEVIGTDAIQTHLPVDWERLQPVAHSYPTGRVALWVRRRKRARDLDLPPGPRAAWMTEWENWMDERQLNERRRRFVRTACELAKQGRQDELPLEPGQHEQDPFRDSKGFWECFTLDEARQLKDFATAQHQRWITVVKEKEVQAMATADKWFSDFFAARGEPGEIAMDVLRYNFARDTQLAGTLHWASKPHGNANTVELAYTLDGTTLRSHYPINPNAPAINWDALEEYF